MPIPAPLSVAQSIVIQITNSVNTLLKDVEKVLTEGAPELPPMNGNPSQPACNAEDIRKAFSPAALKKVQAIIAAANK